MMHLKGIVPILVILGLIFTGCRIEALYNVRNSSVPDLENASLSLDEVKKAIMRSRGAKQVRYKMQDVEPGLIRCELNFKEKHKAWVDIPYSEEGYSILYQRSINLRYYPASDEEPEMIKAHYNNWIRALDVSIQSELGMVSSNDPAVTDVESRLLQLNRLRESGLISEEEFSRKREQILDAL